MDFYPPGHPPLITWMGHTMHPRLQEIMEKGSRSDCLFEAQVIGWMAQWLLENFRALIFRSEALAHTAPLPAQLGEIGTIPTLSPLLLRTVAATRQCLEEWMVSPTYLEIRARHPDRSRE
jgi:hypothetical protein